MSFHTVKRFRAVALVAGVALAALALAAPGQQPPPPPGEVFRVEVDVVNLYCTVKDGKGKLVTDLEPGDFEILAGPSSRDRDLLKATLRAE